MNREEVAKLLGEYYTQKMGGQIYCVFDPVKRAYKIVGHGLLAAPSMRSQYPNGWEMLDWIKPTYARFLIMGMK